MPETISNAADGISSLESDAEKADTAVGTAVGAAMIFFFIWFSGAVILGILTSLTRSTAAYRALSAGDFDVLVHPNYTMTTKNVLWIFRSYKCTVTGYGGKYTNYRTERQKTVIIDGGKEFVFPEK